MSDPEVRRLDEQGSIVTGGMFPQLSADQIRHFENTIIYPMAKAAAALDPIIATRASAAMAVETLHKLVQMPGVLEEALTFLEPENPQTGALA
jgi:hypothetical protein